LRAAILLNVFRIFALQQRSTNGHLKKTIYVDGAHAQDWEDIACGPCAGGQGHCIYIGDLGGNAGGDANTIYRIREPSESLSGGGDLHVQLDGKLEFRSLSAHV